MVIDPLVNDIYEAAILPKKWQVVLDGLAQIADAEGTLLFAASAGVPRWVASKAIRDAMAEWVQSKWYLDNPRGQRLVPLNEPRFLTDFDALTIEEMDASDFYTELLRPRDVGTSIRSPSGDTLVFSIEKAHRKGPVPQRVADELDRLRPHLARDSAVQQAMHNTLRTQLKGGVFKNRRATAGRACKFTRYEICLEFSPRKHADVIGTIRFLSYI